MGILIANLNMARPAPPKTAELSYTRTTKVTHLISIRLKKLWILFIGIAEKMAILGNIDNSKKQAEGPVLFRCKSLKCNREKFNNLV